MEIVLTYDDSLKDRIFAAFGAVYGYNAKIQTQNEEGELALVDNPLSLEGFLLNKVDSYIKAILEQHEVNIATVDAQRAARIKVAEDLKLKGN